MALSEEIGGIDGEDFLTAVVLGIDLSCRLGMAIGEAPGFSEQARGWVRTTVCGIFGATAAACKVLKMKKEQVIDALGIALSKVGGTRQAVTDSALTKRMQPALPSQRFQLSWRGGIGVQKRL
jgi:2-methylcitrate dehydratase PrpD